MISPNILHYVSYPTNIRKWNSPFALANNYRILMLKVIGKSSKLPGLCQYEMSYLFKGIDSLDANNKNRK